MSKMYLNQPNLDFKIPANLGRESDLYLPSSIANTVCKELARVGMKYRVEDIGYEIFRKDIPVPAALLQWKQRFEADGGKKCHPMGYSRITTPYSASEIYKIAQNLFGPTINPEYAKLYKEALEATEKYVEEDIEINKQEAKESRQSNDN